MRASYYYYYYYYYDYNYSHFVMICLTRPRMPLPPSSSPMVGWLDAVPLVKTEFALLLHNDGIAVANMAGLGFYPNTCWATSAAR